MSAEVTPRTMAGRCLVEGSAAGEVLHTDVGLSFMGGVNPRTGEVIDAHHPLRGQNVAGKVLAIPSGRGSCSGSGTLFEMLLGGTAPAALVFSHTETILTVGVLIARELFGASIPVVRLEPDDFAALGRMPWVRVIDGVLSTERDPARPSATDRVAGRTEPPPPGADDRVAESADLDLTGFRLSDEDQRCLAGERGEAARVATRIVIQAAQLEGANDLVDVELAHVDGCFYQGPAGLRFAERLVELGGRVRVTTTMNALCVDRRRWRRQGVAPSLGEPSDALADAYLRLGTTPTYTCAPYLLRGAPVSGQQIAWAESNAVVFANSVIGARTMKYPDYLDVLIALIGRAPYADCHRLPERVATVQVDVAAPAGLEDSFYPTLGYHLGTLVPNEIPVLCGLDPAAVSRDDLKAFGAAFATTSAAPMFHVLGVTPEARTLDQALGGNEPRRHVRVGRADLLATWRELNTATTADVDLVALGNPHFSLTECERLAALCEGREKAADVTVTVTLGREVYDSAQAAGFVERVEAFGATFVTDTCWCLLTEPLIPPGTGSILTNSGKYAHYGAAATGRGLHLRSLAHCVDAVCTGRVDTALPSWLAA